jgi:hypothetical protein
MAGKKRRRGQVARRNELPAGMQRTSRLGKQLKVLVDLVVEVARTTENGLFAIPRTGDATQDELIRFDAAILVRGSNALKATRLLCKEGFWESAVGCVRQLFELVLHAEHIARQPDRHAAIATYAKYGLLQMVREQAAESRYDESTGRTIDIQRLTVLESMLEQTFPEFRHVSATGHVSWDKSWSRMDARRLAELSTHPLRKKQYELLFSSWSEQVHAVPGALLDDLFRHEIAVEKIVRDDVTRSAEALSMGVTFFLELAMLLPSLPRLDPTSVFKWTTILADQADVHGAQRAPLGHPTLEGEVS